MGKLYKKAKKFVLKTGGVIGAPLENNLDSAIKKKVLGDKKFEKTQQADPLTSAYHKNFEDIHFIGSEVESAYDARVEAEAAAEAEANKPVMPIPDEQELARIRRRRARRDTGRASTILTDSDRFGI